MATFNLIDEFYNDLLKGEHTFGASGDVFKIRLSNTAPTKATDATINTKTAVTGGGYEDKDAGSGGVLSITEPSTGVWQIGDTDDGAVFSAVSTNFSAAQYAYLYNHTNGGSSGKIVGVMDYTSEFTVTAGNSFTVDPGANGYVRFTTPTWA
jgi:hypothetical protein